MDRRTFLTGVGGAGVAGAIAKATGVLESTPDRARVLKAAGSAASARAAGTVGRASATVLADGMTLGYLPGSAALFATAVSERKLAGTMSGLAFGAWSADAARSMPGLSLFKSASTVDVRIGSVRSKANATQTPGIRFLEVIAHYALDDSAGYAEFTAASYDARASAGMPRATQALSFLAEMPYRVALTVNYILDPATVAGGVAGSGSLYLPIGSSATSGGLATGLYVLAATSAGTGTAPDYGQLVFSGDARSPLSIGGGGAIDFDYIPLAIRPVAI